MRVKFGSVTCFLMACFLATSASSELQNVVVGGQIRLLGEYYRACSPAETELRWPAQWLVGRPIGTAGNEIRSGFGWDRRDPGLSTVTQRTMLNIKADFTENVAAFVEFESIDVWGEDFRSDYLSGADRRANTSDDIELYQGYIDVNELFGSALRLRIGRQELVFGSGWLVGNNDAGPSPAWGLSFDALRLTYTADKFTIDAWRAKLAKSSPLEEDGDVDFSGVYGTYTGVEKWTFDAYWLWLRDARSLKDTSGAAFPEWIESIAGVDDYKATNIHTAGLRGAGTAGAFDFEAEAAYQLGSAGQAGYLFKPVRYGDEDAEYDAWTAHATVGYTFSVAWKPRLQSDYCYFGGEDNRDVSFREWLDALFNPFYRGSSVSFNRLFSDACVHNILDGTDVSNLHAFSVGAAVSPTEKVEVTLDISYLMADKAFEMPAAPLLGFLSEPNSRDLGVEVCLAAAYQYTNDIYFIAGWDHLFLGKGLEQGQFMQAYGFDFNGGSDDDDADYFFFEMGLSF